MRVGLSCVIEGGLPTGGLSSPAAIRYFLRALLLQWLLWL